MNYIFNDDKTMIMKKVILLLLSLCAIGLLQTTAQTDDVACLVVDGDGFLVESAGDDGVVADGINKSDCTFTKDGRIYKLYGKVQIINSFPDIKVQIVDSFSDVDVQIVNSFPDDCGKVQIVNSFPDVKVQIVDSFPDIKVRIVNSFHGVK